MLRDFPRLKNNTARFIRTQISSIEKCMCVCVCVYIYIYNFASCLYGCETWSLTLGEERRLRVFENRVLSRIFGPKRDEVTGEWIKTA